MTSFTTIQYKEGKLYLLDQRLLPAEVSTFVCDDYRAVEFAIRDMVVRGAPAIGVAGAYGVAMAAAELAAQPGVDFLSRLSEAGSFLEAARPTAVNLTWGIRRMLDLAEAQKEETPDRLADRLLSEAHRIYQEDLETNRAIADHGNTIVPEGAVILTHCNTGALATAGIGTALGVIRAAHDSGKDIRVYADETRPRFQGARLTAWELVREGIPATLIPDSVSAVLIRDGKIDVILVGADRIALNGDTANKIGTYMVSQLARDFGVPFYIVAPLSTVDFQIASGRDIPIEEREAREVTHVGSEQVAPEGIQVYNPAFDVTPWENITGIITERGIARAPFEKSLLALRDQPL